MYVVMEVLCVCIMFFQLGDHGCSEVGFLDQFESFFDHLLLCGKVCEWIGGSSLGWCFLRWICVGVFSYVFLV